MDNITHAFKGRGHKKDKEIETKTRAKIKKLLAKKITLKNKAKELKKLLNQSPSQAETITASLELYIEGKAPDLGTLILSGFMLKYPEHAKPAIEALNRIDSKKAINGLRDFADTHEGGSYPKLVHRARSIVTANEKMINDLKNKTFADGYVAERLKKEPHLKVILDINEEFNSLANEGIDVSKQKKILQRETLSLCSSHLRGSKERFWTASQTKQ